MIPLGALLVRRCFMRPILVGGENRSGTSILKRALGQHPAVLSASGEEPQLGAIGGLVREIEVHQYYSRCLRIPRQVFYAHLRQLCFESALGPRFGLSLA